MTTPQVDRVAELTAELEQERKWHYEQADKAHALQAALVAVSDALGEMARVVYRSTSSAPEGRYRTALDGFATGLASMALKARTAAEGPADERDGICKPATSVPGMVQVSCPSCGVRCDVAPGCAPVFVHLEGWPCARELPPRPRCACNGEYRCPGPHTPSAP